MSHEYAVTFKKNHKMMKSTDDWVKIIMKVSDITTWSFTTITVANSIISLFKRHWSDMIIMMLLMLKRSWWCKCHQILIKSLSFLLFKLLNIFQLLKRKFKKWQEKKWLLMLRQWFCWTHRLREIKKQW